MRFELSKGNKSFSSLQYSFSVSPFAGARITLSMTSASLYQ